MTQLDLPQISLSRYVDLLKRRRWQVIPVSLLGLLVGGLVAFFIPRYYVAKAAIAYQQPTGERPADPKDPFGAIIDTAKLTLPLAIPETIKSLGWPEGLTEDRFVLGENVNAIADRLQISEYGNSKNRPFALIRVTYKDRDGLRAAAFLNKLVATWIEQRQGQLMDNARRQLASATEEHKQHSDAYNTFLQKRQHLQQTYRIEPGLELSVQRIMHRTQVDRLDQDVKDLSAKKVEIARLTATIANARIVLGDMPARVRVDLTTMHAEAAKSPEGQALVAQIAYFTLAKANLNAGHPRQAYYDRNIAYLAEQLTKLVAAPEVDAEGMMSNPARETQRVLIADFELELKLAEAVIGEFEARITAEDARLARQSDGYTLYEGVDKRLGEARQSAEAATAKMQAATDTVGKLTNQPSIRPEGRATVPPAPTDPNLLLVALLGCVIGLFAATALVLLLDVVQGSYKTVDDVERGLAVPVLGGVSHLETEMQRRLAVRSRRRATLVAAAFLTLVGGVVLLYYFDPTRLPPFVRDMLSMVLGTA